MQRHADEVVAGLHSSTSTNDLSARKPRHGTGGGDKRDKQHRSRRPKSHQGSGQAPVAEQSDWLAPQKGLLHPADSCSEAVPAHAARHEGAGGEQPQTLTRGQHAAPQPHGDSTHCASGLQGAGVAPSAGEKVGGGQSTEKGQEEEEEEHRQHPTGTGIPLGHPVRDPTQW